MVLHEPGGNVKSIRWEEFGGGSRLRAPRPHKLVTGGASQACSAWLERASLRPDGASSRVEEEYCRPCALVEGRAKAARCWKGFVAPVLPGATSHRGPSHRDTTRSQSAAIGFTAFFARRPAQSTPSRCDFQKTIPAAARYRAVALSRQARRAGGWISFKGPLGLPHSVQKHRQFSRHGHDGFPLAAFPAAFG